MLSPDTALIDLVDGDLTLSLAPAIGGGVVRFAHRGEHILRPTSGSALAAGDPLGLACFPLVPFSGRVKNGAFDFEGRAIRLPPNIAGEVNAIHGQGWRGAWRAAARTANAATLRFEHRAGDWPWTYEAVQRFALSGGALTVALTVVNRGPGPMPAGLGLHPYFPRDADTRLTATATGVWQSGAVMPLSESEAWNPPGGSIGHPPADHVVTGWNGAARIDWPSRGRGVRITTGPAAPCLVVYAPLNGNFLCVEPVSHAAGALNRSEGGVAEGMRILPVGRALSLTTRFEVFSF